MGLTTVWTTLSNGPIWLTLFLLAIVLAVIVYYIATGTGPHGHRPRAKPGRRKQVYDPRNPDDCMEYINKYGEPLRHRTTRKE